MNQKTLQNIYKSFETEEFYKRYLVELGCRQDRRTANQQRTLKVTARNNSVVLSCGQTIIIVHLQAAITSVTYSPITNSYGEPLLKLKVTSSNQAKHYRENKGDKAIEQYINTKINWSIVEDQLAGSDLLTGKQFAYKGDISLRILGDDGGVEEYGLIAVQLLLWTCKFKKFTINKERINFEEDYKLKLTQFIFPIKYCEIISMLMIDPSLSQEENSNIEITVLKDLKQLDKPQTVIQRVRKSASRISQEFLKKVLSQWEIDIAKNVKKFENLLNQLESSGEGVLE